MNDSLTTLLKTWQPEVPASGDFRRGVWRKIEAASLVRLPGPMERVLLFIARPRVALAVAVLAIFAGGVAGSSIAGAQEANAYLRSVNPYAQSP